MVFAIERRGRRHSKLDLGYLTTTALSLEETAGQFNKLINTMEEAISVEEKPYTMHYLFSSRGSTPFVLGLNYIAEKQFRKGFTFRIVPHIYSIENLLAIVSDYDILNYDTYEPILHKFYDDIAKTMNHKIRGSCRKTNRLFTDWDEVITGRNLSERIKVYNRLSLPGNDPFFIVSFLDDRMKKLERRSTLTFKKHYKKSPSNYATMNIILEHPITWSDNEEFFGDVGLKYPVIAAPDATTVRNLIRRKALPEFYFHFLDNYYHFLAFDVYQDTHSLKYKLLQRRDDKLFGNDRMLDVSLAAYQTTMMTMPKAAFKTKRPRGDYRVDTDHGIILSRDNGNHPVLRLQHERANIPYANPFLLVYEGKGDRSKELTTLLRQYIDAIKRESEEDTKTALQPVKTDFRK